MLRSSIGTAPVASCRAFKPEGYACRSFRRLAAPVHALDFAHHAKGVARLNHGSFGSPPLSVQRAEDRLRQRWRENPDAVYFGDTLSMGLRAAAGTVAEHMGVPDVDGDRISLVENATVATATIARRWERLLRDARRSHTGDGILLMSCCYKAVKYSLKAICEPVGGIVHISPVPFPDTTRDTVLSCLEATLKRTRPRFALLDHISSQPSILLPIAEAVALCRQYGCEEVAVNGAHALGQLDVDVTCIGADFYYSNVHKWAFAGSPVCALYCATAAMDASTSHVVPSWYSGKGLAHESRWTGTRDYAGALAVPEALDYLKSWRSVDGLDAVAYNALGWRQAAEQLSEAWDVELPMADDCMAPAMGMVRLPSRLDLSRDQPGQPSEGVRATLRERYGIEAALGGFGDAGGFVRLSHAVYNTDEDYERLQHAVLELCGSAN